MSNPLSRPPAPATDRPDRVDVDLVVDDPRWPAAADRLGHAVRAALEGAAWRTAGTLTLVLADDRTVQDLNRTWRERDRPTNVLSFPGDQAPLPGGPPPHLGDVVLAYETVTREAAEQGKALLDHAIHLVVHGVLHLLGFDHETEAEAVRMETLETRLLADLGIADPYRESAA